MANFSTPEDKLLEKHWDQNPGKLFKEVELGRDKEIHSDATRLQSAYPGNSAYFKSGDL